MASTSSTSSTPILTPRLGEIHPTYGVCLAGAPLDDMYRTAPGRVLFWFSTQRRTGKTLGSIERKLMDDRDSITTVKFDGKLEAPIGSSNEVGKERFIQLLQQRVKEHGQQSFYHITDTEGKVVDLVEHSHRFNLSQVITECERRSDPMNAAKRFAYDQFELDDIEISHLVVDSLLLEPFRQKIEVRFNHRTDFEYLPGSCLFMMVMDTCNASVSHDVEGARVKFDALTLHNYPGEHVTDLMSDTQRLVKIMQVGYALPVNLGSRIVQKVAKTSSEFFNWKMFTLLDNVKTFEHPFKLMDPKTLLTDTNYAKYGPLSLIATVQQAHSSLLLEHDWPALATQLPQSNNVSPDNSNSSSSPLHNGTVHTPHRSVNERRSPRKLADWKYIEPRDLTKSYRDARGREWKFCTKCKCRVTHKTGLYQLSHFDHEHRDNFRRGDL